MTQDYLTQWLEQQHAPKKKTRAEKRTTAEYNSSGIPAPAPEPPKPPQITDPHVHSGDIIKIPGFRGEFVVEHAAMTGGDGRLFADAWHVYARRLNKDRSYNSRGKVVVFTQNTAEFTTCIKGVQVTGRR